jgi:hypothetical protein
MYDTICRKKLADIMLTIIDEQRFFDTLHKMFNAEIVRIDIKDPCILQENTLSLLRCNIYLHK